MMKGSRFANGKPSIVSGTVGAKCCQRSNLFNNSILLPLTENRLRSDILSPATNGLTYKVIKNEN